MAAPLAKHIAVRRFYNQRLAGPKFQTPEQVVAWLGAVQAQEYAHAKWALALRMESATDDLVEKAFTEGAILRTHVMRPTWHFVAPADIRWLLELTAPRVHMVSGTMYRRLELDDALLARGDAVIARTLEGGRSLTRKELGAALVESGIVPADGQRLAYLIMHAELEGVVCSGPKCGKQHTYMLLDERAPNARRLPRDEALAELTLRYFSSHGPATEKDFSWWSGLTLTDVRAGLAMLDSQLAREEIDGETCYFSASGPAAGEPQGAGHLLPIYDEFTIGYQNHAASHDPMYAKLLNERLFTSAFVLGGEIIGMWRRTLSKQAVVVESAPFHPFDAAETEAFAAAAGRFGDFLGLPVELA